VGDCTAGKFHWHFGVDEIVHILEGEVHVTDDAGRTVTLQAGDVGHFALGSHTVWEVPDYVCKLAFHRVPTLPIRVKRKLRRMLVPGGAVLIAPVVCALPA
jgi:ethanolamine utilization protein EutQ (cupin superfamily)